MSTANVKVPGVQGLWKINYTKLAAPSTTQPIFATNLSVLSPEFNARINCSPRELPWESKFISVILTWLTCRPRNFGHLRSVKVSESTKTNSEGTRVADAPATAAPRTVTLVTGCLDRDRIDEKTCALYEPAHVSATRPISKHYWYVQVFFKADLQFVDLPLSIHLKFFMIFGVLGPSQIMHEEWFEL
jgi:hypothetical protein